MKCIHCQGAMTHGTAPIHIDRGGCHLTIDDVPAWICEQCGEPLFDEKEVAAIQDLIESLDQKCRTLQRSA
jgi:YgiT-type zinc finger domain-containing protein